MPVTRQLLKMAALLMTAGGLSATTLHVSPSGSPASDGNSPGQPTTLNAALQRATIDAEIEEIILAGGRYELQSTLDILGIIRPETNPLRVVASSGTRPQIHGAKALAGKWTPLDAQDPLAGRLPEDAKPFIWVTTLADSGVHDFGERTVQGIVNRRVAPGELFLDGRRQIVAGWPDKVDSGTEGDFAIEAGHLVFKASTGNSVAFPAEKLAAWQGIPDLWAHGYWGDDWADTRLPVASLDPVGGWMTLAERPPYGFKEEGAVRVSNLPEELDSPGEWFLDRASGKLYVWPSDSSELDKAFFSTVNAPLLRLAHSRHVVFEKLDFAYSRAELVKLEHSEEIIFRGCSFRGSGLGGITIDGERNRVEECLFEDIGESAIDLNGGDLPTLRPGANIVVNNVMRRYGQRYYAYSAGVRLRGVGHLVAHNLIEDAPHVGIQVNGARHLIWRNEIREVCQFTDDAGAIYSGRDWTGWGNRIEENYIHDIRTRRGHKAWVHGVYLDDCASGFTVLRNIFERIDGFSTDVGGGRQNRIIANLSLSVGGVHLDDNRGSKWISHSPGDSWNMIEGILEDGAFGELWAHYFPELAETPLNWEESAPYRLPRKSTFVDNAGRDFEEWAKEVDWTGQKVFAHYDAVDRTPKAVTGLPESSDLRDLETRRDFTIAGVSEPLPFTHMGLASSRWQPAEAAPSSARVIITWENAHGVFAGETTLFRLVSTKSLPETVTWGIDGELITGAPTLRATLFKPGVYPLSASTADQATKSAFEVLDASLQTIPFPETATKVPGKIEAEAFDVNGAFDTTPENKGLPLRETEVDLDQQEGATFVGWTQPGEWLEYTVEADPGKYAVVARAASRNDFSGLRVEWDGRLVAARKLPNVGNNLSFKEVYLGEFVVEEVGPHTLRVTIIGKDLNFDYLRVVGLDSEGIFDPKLPSSGLTPATPAPDPVPGERGLIAEWFLDLSGASVAHLLQAEHYPHFPDAAAAVENFVIPSRDESRFGVRVRGWLVPETSGEYRFWIAGDDQAQLSLSTDADPANATVVASLHSHSKSEQWDKYPEQASTTIPLEAGKAYYIEALLKQEWGGSHLNVAWEGPGLSREVIPNTALRQLVENWEGVALEPSTGDGNPASGGEIDPALHESEAQIPLLLGLSTVGNQFIFRWSRFSEATNWVLEHSEDLIAWSAVSAEGRWNNREEWETVTPRRLGYFRLRASP
jgi:hypothetical protein